MLIGRTLTPEYKDKTVVYDDSLGLPKTVEMYSSYGHLISKYEVLQSTKIGGWSIPLEFKLLQHDPPPSDAPLIESNPSTTEVLGHVTSIVKVLRIDLPAELGDQQAKEAK